MTSLPPRPGTPVVGGSSSNSRVPAGGGDRGAVGRPLQGHSDAGPATGGGGGGGAGGGEDGGRRAGAAPVSGMAGLCGCWQLSSHGHCDGCGYKVLLRGALNPGERSARQGTSPPVLIKREKREETPAAGDTPIRQLQASPSQRRRHSHPLHLAPLQGPALSHSLQRRPPNSLPQSSAYNVPLESEVPLGGAQHAWTAGAAFPHQMLLSTMQPPEELRCSSRSRQSPQPTAPPSPRPAPRPPPFDLGSFIPPLSPGVLGFGEQEGAAFFSGGGAPASHLHTRYHALSLARSSSRSHTDLREAPPLTTPAPSPRSRPPSLYCSLTLPPPPPPPRARRVSVRRPQEVRPYAHTCPTYLHPTSPPHSNTHLPTTDARCPPHNTGIHTHTTSPHPRTCCLPPPRNQWLPV